MPGIHSPQNLCFTPGVGDNAGPERSTVGFGIAKRHGADRVPSGGGNGRDSTIHGANDDVQVVVGECLVDAVGTGRPPKDFNAFGVFLRAELVVECALQQLLARMDCILLARFSFGECLNVRTGRESNIYVVAVELHQLSQGAYRGFLVAGEKTIPSGFEVVIWRFRLACCCSHSQ